MKKSIAIILTGALLLIIASEANAQFRNNCPYFGAFGGICTPRGLSGRTPCTPLALDYSDACNTIAYMGTIQ